MKRIFVDTSFFLRFLLRDVDEQHQKAKELFRKATQGKVNLFTSVIVLFELYWVLTSFYQKRKLVTIKMLGELLKLKFIELPERELLIQALEVYQDTNLDLEDSYNLVYACFNKADRLASFDKNLQNLFTKRKR